MAPVLFSSMGQKHVAENVPSVPFPSEGNTAEHVDQHQNLVSAMSSSADWKVKGKIFGYLFLRLTTAKKRSHTNAKGYFQSKNPSRKQRLRLPNGKSTS